MAAIYDVPYMQRTRDYYRAQGYDTDYQWAHHQQTPLAQLRRPVEAATVAVITTAMPDTKAGRSQRQVYSMPSHPAPETMYTAELSWDKKATHTNDVGSFLPLEILHNFAERGIIGALAARFHSVPTEYSQRNTRMQDAPEIVRRCLEDQVEVALLVPL